MASPQTGIFALGTASHAYLELDATSDAAALVAAVASLREPRTTMGGVNLVAGFRPELWRELRPEDTPADAAGFNADIAGIEGFVMPATQHDAVLWISGGSYDVVFDVRAPRSRRSATWRRSARRPRAGRITTIST